MPVVEFRQLPSWQFGPLDSYQTSNNVTLFAPQDLVTEDDELWEGHCKQEFKGKKPGEDETWRELFIRLKYERELKLKSITAHINRKSQKATPGRLQTTVHLLGDFLSNPNHFEITSCESTPVTLIWFPIWLSAPLSAHHQTGLRRNYPETAERRQTSSGGERHQVRRPSAQVGHLLQGRLVDRFVIEQWPCCQK